MKPKLNLCLPLILISCLQTGMALPGDDQQALKIISDRFSYHALERSATYEGHVLATQGTRQLTGDRAVIYFDPQHHIESIHAYGKPAKFQDQPDLNQPMVYAEALHMEYQPTHQLLTFYDQAKLTQANNTLVGQLMHYNTQTQIADSEGASTNEVRPLMIIQPDTLKQKVSNHG